MSRWLKIVVLALVVLVIALSCERDVQPPPGIRPDRPARPAPLR
jgi:hypothetical protein